MHPTLAGLLHAWMIGNRLAGAAARDWVREHGSAEVKQLLNEVTWAWDSEMSKVDVFSIRRGLAMERLFRPSRRKRKSKMRKLLLAKLREAKKR